MPGILPMKVIKLGTSAQSRIAQACDRCRSKKIRCDGITPCCTQCANIGFECKTSDKLSRRAFPRGYTESLEERVRSLEQEVRELKDLLDEKDEKIDILSRIHSRSPASTRSSNERSSPSGTEEGPHGGAEHPQQDVFRMQQSPSLLGGGADSYFMGASSGRSFIDTFKRRVQESGKPSLDFDTDAFFPSYNSPTATPKASPAKLTETKAPPRLVSDQMINIFFQEWAPLFPILHRPAFLNLYTEYVSDPENMKDQHAIAQLNLVFGIAALSTEWNKQDTGSFERQWCDALEAVLSENTLSTLQCLVLAQLYCVAKADYDKLLHYKSLAISLSHRLALHQSQKQFSHGALTTETRKKVFWTLYTLDCFSAALLGLPKLLKEEDIRTEYPVDIDDENVFERGFQPTLPGESTRLSSALALFRGSRILAKVLGELYPASPSYELSLRGIGALSDELDVWLNSLPSHLRLQFVQDKPSTNVVGSRSPFLSLAFHYIRTLIHRPAAGSSLGAKASSSVVALANSSKHIIQIIELLEERRMSFSFSLNKNELLLLSGFALLYQGLNLNRKGKLMQDSQRVVCSAIAILERSVALGSADFKRLACAMVSIDKTSKPVRAANETSVPRKKASGRMEAPQAKAKSGRRQLQAMAARFSTGNLGTFKKESNVERRATVPTTSASSVYGLHQSRPSICSAIELHRPQHHEHSVNLELQRSTSTLDIPNLDYLSFGDDGGPTPSLSTIDVGSVTKGLNVDHLSGSFASPPSFTTFDSVFSASDPSDLYITPSPSTTHQDWGSDLWALTADPSFTGSELKSVEDWSIHGLGLEALDASFGA